MSEIPNNDLYMVVLPMIHLGITNYGFTEQVLTLLPDRKFATSFFPDEVEGYILAMKHREQYIKGGHVTGYEYQKENTSDGRVRVRVVQIVEE